MVSSLVHEFARKIDFSNENFLKPENFVALMINGSYSISKLANVMFALKMQK